MKAIYGVAAFMSIGALCGGCAPTTISPNWGTAYQDMRAKQVLHPEAGEELTPVEGQDGRITATSMEAYRKGFEKPDADFERSVVTSGVQTK